MATHDLHPNFSAANRVSFGRGYGLPEPQDLAFLHKARARTGTSLGAMHALQQPVQPAHVQATWSLLVRV